MTKTQSTYQQRESAANARADQLLTQWGQGETIETMSAETYRRMRATLSREGHWHGGR